MTFQYFFTYGHLLFRFLYLIQANPIEILLRKQPTRIVVCPKLILIPFSYLSRRLLSINKNIYSLYILCFIIIIIIIPKQCLQLISYNIQLSKTAQLLRQKKQTFIGTFIFVLLFLLEIFTEHKCFKEDNNIFFTYYSCLNFFFYISFNIIFSKACQR